MWMDSVECPCTGHDLPGREVDNVIESCLCVPSHDVWPGHTVEEGEYHEDLLIESAFCISV